MFIASVVSEVMGKTRDVEDFGKCIVGMEHIWDFVEVVSRFNAVREV